MQFLSRPGLLRHRPRTLQRSPSACLRAGQIDLAGWRVKMQPVKGGCASVINTEIRGERDSTGRDGATHQVLVAETSELLKLLRYEELSAADCTADCPQHCTHTHTKKVPLPTVSAKQTHARVERCYIEELRQHFVYSGLTVTSHLSHRFPLNTLSVSKVKSSPE